MQNPQRIVVGIDGTLASRAAIDWAVTHSDILGDVQPVYAWDYPVMATAGSPFGYAGIPPTPDMQDAAERAAHDFVASLDGVDSTAITIKGDPGVAICGAADTADTIVIGTRHRGPLRANVLGSVGRYCADHAPVPLVIVPHHEGEPIARAARVAVGIDGSNNSFEALLWAGRSFPDAVLAAVTSWQTPVDAPVLFGGDRFDLAAFRSHAKALVNETADKAAAEIGCDPGRIERRIAEGDPRWVLAAAQEEADLLVLGRRGRTGLKHLVLGSTTTSLIHQPRCPVAVVPDPDDHP
jgi:nucleotide-binding universal stress UspA family protein